MLYIATSSGHFPISPNYLPEELLRFANCKDGVLACNGSMFVYKANKNNIDSVVDNTMQNHPHSIVLIYADDNHYALLLGREANWKIIK